MEKKPKLQVVDRPADFKGIENLVFVEASSLRRNPQNWKTHTRRQLEALDGELSTVGWALPMVYNLNTGRLVDGHGRQETETVKRQGVVPVVIGRWTEEEERQILLHLDPIGAMFETDSRKYDALMAKHREEFAQLEEEIESHHRDAIDEVNKSLDIHHDAIRYGGSKSFLPDFSGYEEDNSHESIEVKEVTKIEQVPSSLPGAYDLKTWIETPFNAFGVGGPFGIPKLRPDRLGDVPPGKAQTWAGPETPEGDWYFYIYGSAAIEKVRSNEMVVSFYTYDEKFESIWNDPRKFTARMINLNVNAVISVNFSVWSGAPQAFDIWQTYRSRWLARYWQEAGLKVIPDIMLGIRDEFAFDLRIKTLPKNMPCISVQLQQKASSNPQAYYADTRVDLAKVVSHLKPNRVILYHGPDFPKNYTRDLPSDVDYVKVPTFMSERTKILNSKEYLK